MGQTPSEVNTHQCSSTPICKFTYTDSKYTLSNFAVPDYIWNIKFQSSSFGTGTFHSTLLKSKESLQINDSIISLKDFSVLWTRKCRTWRSDWWELFWYCSNESHIICTDKHDQLLYHRKKIWNKSQLKAAENKLDDVILISQSEYDIRSLDYLSVHRVLDSLR